jgi:hypothetical protein
MMVRPPQRWRWALGVSVVAGATLLAMRAASRQQSPVVREIVREPVVEVPAPVVALALADRQQVAINLQDVHWLRLDLEPWRDTEPVRELDEQLAAVGGAR